MDRLKVAVVVINYKGLANTLDCLSSLAKVESAENILEIIVVENGSGDGSAHALSKLKDIHLLTSFENLGFAGGANLGIKFARLRQADYVIILNNDTVVDKLAVVKLLSATKVGEVISPKIYFAPGFEFHKVRYKKEDSGKVIWYAGGKIDWDNIIGIHQGVDQIDKGQFNRRNQIDLATGACMMVKSEVFEKIGLFDEKYFLYLEDMDFCTRAKAAGVRIIFEPQAIIWHKNAGSTGGSGSALQDYYITRNRLLFAFKYAPVRTKLAVLRQVLRQINKPVKRKALIDFLTGNFGKGSFLK